MYKSLKIAVAVPAYNEEKLIQKTLTTMPSFVDNIVVINDGSIDQTLKKINEIKKADARVTLIDNGRNFGIGHSLKAAIKKAHELGADRVAVMAGDAQMDPEQLAPMLDEMNRRELDFIKANRFLHFDALQKMPTYRRIGNTIVTILTKFATGYYTIFDTQNGYVIYSREIIDRMPWRLVGERYEFENTVLIALSIIDAKIADFAMPALYGTEKSTIKLLSTTNRVLKVLFKGFWQRIFYKYIMYGFHPIALFLITGNIIFDVGILYGIWLIVDKIFNNVSPSSGTVMLAVLPIIVGLQLVLTAITMDVIEEKK